MTYCHNQALNSQITFQLRIMEGNSRRNFVDYAVLDSDLPTNWQFLVCYFFLDFHLIAPLPVRISSSRTSSTDYSVWIRDVISDNYPFDGILVVWLWPSSRTWNGHYESPFRGTTELSQMLGSTLFLPTDMIYEFLTEGHDFPEWKSVYAKCSIPRILLMKCRKK